MKNGKISESIYKRSVLRQLHSENDDCIKAANVGEDFAVTSNAVAVSKSFDLDIRDKDSFAMIAVCRAVNAVAQTGAIPVGLTVSVMIPTLANEADFRELVKALDKACSKTGVKLMQVDSVVTRACKTFVVTCTCIGKPGDRHTFPSKLAAGMDIIAVNYAGLEGSALLAIEREEELKKKYSIPFIDKAKKYIEYLPIISEAAVAVQSGVCAMHDISEGGIYGALWEMGQGSGVGLEIDLKQIPIRQETIEICEFFDVNPYKLLSTGSLLMAAEDGNAVVRAIRQAGGEAAVIGKATDSNDRVLLCEDERRFLETTQTDELWEFNKKKEIAK